MQIDISKLPPHARIALANAFNKQTRTHTKAAQFMAGAPNVVNDGIVTIQNPLPRLDPSPDDARDYPYIWSGKPPMDDMDQRPLYDTDIRDQGPIGMCTGEATVSACQSIAFAAGAPMPRLSPQANYSMSRDYDRLGPSDGGAYLRTALKCAQRFGLALESLWPLNTQTVGTLQLPQPVMDDAATRKMGQYYRIDPMNFYRPWQKVRMINAALAEGKRVVVASYVMQWLRELTGPIETHHLQRNESNTYIIGAHAFDPLRAKYVQGAPTRVYGARNSWGPNYGDAGHFGLLESDFDSVFEIWVVDTFAGITVPSSPYDVNGPQAKTARLYRGALGRYPDVAGLDYWTDVLARGAVSLIDMATAFLASPEAQATYGATTDAQYVTQLYANVLGRNQPGLDEINYWVGTLRAGTSRAQVLLAFTESEENKATP